MLSLNVPLPPAVRRLVADLAPDIVGMEPRRSPGLVCKRLGDPAAHEVPALKKRARRALRGAAPAEARVAELDYFADPPSGPAPVLYLAVESPGIHALHDRLCEVVDPVPGLESEGYVPHVTVARGGDRQVADRLAGREVGPVTWTVDALEFRDARHGESVGRVSLP